MAMMMPNGIAAHKIVIGFFFFIDQSLNWKNFITIYCFYVISMCQSLLSSISNILSSFTLSLFAHCNFSIRLNFKKFLNCKHNGPFRGEHNLIIFIQTELNQSCLKFWLSPSLPFIIHDIFSYLKSESC